MGMGAFEKEKKDDGAKVRLFWEIGKKERFKLLEQTRNRRFDKAKEREKGN